MIVFAVILIFFILLGVFTLMYQMYNLVELDARSRGLKHPRFWGIFALGGNNGSGGLLLYLIGRRKYQSVMTEEEKIQFNSRKKRAGISLCFLAAGTIGIIAMTVLGYF